MTQPTPTITSGIVGRYEEDFIAEANQHAWNDNLYELEIDGQCREYTFEQIKILCKRRGWDWRREENSNSTVEIFNRSHKYECGNCKSKAMYDDNRDEFYCPQCE